MPEAVVVKAAFEGLSRVCDKYVVPYSICKIYIYIYTLELTPKRDAMPARSVAALRRSESSLKLQGRIAAAC